ncbi:mechanosensitive ion channel protein 6 [Pistacia vera]|uniref:mechanosensitive ion channel protein 6 n=1 Tax=Pistacia vera TaxID=55513 RepID=UPI001263B365|nr:mechanosensitive ion channel protein 6 [Pistacia vera]XP_031266047.1 mechanosensitive ion channel protein 6 [Pistacia vera]
MAVDSPDRRDVVIKVEGDKTTTNTNNSKIWRESSYDFWQDRDRNKNNNMKKKNGEEGKSGEEEGDFDFMQRGAGIEDPPSKLIGQFLHKQKASGEISLDMDLDMDELQQQEAASENNGNINVYNYNEKQTLPTVAESPTLHNKDNRVSFESFKRRHSNSNSSYKDSPQKDSEGEVLKCTSNRSFDRDVSFNRKSRVLMTKTKSRLFDPPQDRVEQKSGRVVGRSAQLKSGFIARNAEDEEDDPFLEEDLPDEYKKEKISLWVVLEWLSLILIIAALVSSLTFKFLKGRHLWKLELWKWEVLILVLICGRLVSSWIVRIVVFLFERNFLLRKRVLYFVYGLRKAVQNCLWLGLVLIAWHYLFDKKVQRETNSKVLRIVTKILVCLLVGVLLWLVKTLLVKVLASSFHVSTYFDRIQEALFNQYVIETLSGPPVIEIQKAEEEEERIAVEVQKLQNAGATIPPGLKTSALSSPQNPKLMGSGRLQKTPRGGKSPRISRALSNKEEDGITIDHLHKLNHKNVSAWNMKRLINIVRYGSLTTLDEHIQNSSQADESGPHIKSEYEAKVAAKKIFQNVAKQGSKFIFLEDLMRFLPEEEAEKTMSLFEGASESNRISKSALKNWVVNVFRERRALAFTLNDTKTAVNRLHHMVNTLVAIIIVIIWLLILGIATTKFLLFVSSQLVVVAFVFGNTCKTVFEAIIFLFVMHPFDVGDRCEIEGVQMVVEEMNILTTVFLRYDNQKIIIPNSVLATKAISNYYRSPDMGDAVEFCIHVCTPAEKIAHMKQRILSYVDNKKDHWYPQPMIVFKELEELNRVRIAVWLTHRMNHQDMGEKWLRRALLVEEMVKIFKDLDIQYRLYPIDINVRAMPSMHPMNSDHISSNRTANL